MTNLLPEVIFTEIQSIKNYAAAKNKAKKSSTQNGNTANCVAILAC